MKHSFELCLFFHLITCDFKQSNMILQGVKMISKQPINACIHSCTCVFKFLIPMHSSSSPINLTGPSLSPVRKDTSVGEQPWCCLTSLSPSSSSSSSAPLRRKPPPTGPRLLWLQQVRSCGAGPSSWCGTCPLPSVTSATTSTWTWETSASWRTGGSTSRDR